MKNFINLTTTLLFILLSTHQAVAEKPIKLGDKFLENSNLHEVVNPKVSLAYIDPSVDFSGYKEILVYPLNFDNVKIIQPSDSGTGLNRKFELNEKDKTDIEKIYQDAMSKYLQEKGDFVIVENPAPDALILYVEVVEIQPNAPKDDSDRDFYSGTMTVYTEGAGSMTISAGLADSESGKTLAAFADRKDGSDMWGVNNRVTNLGDVSLSFSQWAQELNDTLKKLQENKIQR